MLSTLDRERRTRRQTQFHLETLDDRIVLSAAAAGAAAETATKVAMVDHRREVRIARHEEVLARREARHEARLHRVEARHEARLHRVEARLAFAAARASVPSPNTAAMAAAMNPTAASGTASMNSAGASASISSGTQTATTPAVPMMMTTTSESPNSRPIVPLYPVTNPTAATATSSGTTTSSTTTSPSTLPANVSAALQALYQEYENDGAPSSFKPSLPSDNELRINGTNVGVSLKVSASSDFNTTLSQLQSDGLNVTASSSTYGIIDGMLPIADLPTVATMVASVAPMTPPLVS